MAVRQLSYIGEQNRTIPRNLAIEHFTETFSNNSLIVSNRHDTKIPEYLEIELNPSINRDFTPLKI